MLSVRIRCSSLHSNPKLAQKRGELYVHKHVVIADTKPLYLADQISNLEKETFEDPGSLSFVTQFVMDHVPSLDVERSNPIATATKRRHNYGTVLIPIYRVKANRMIWSIT